jgi:hypothetical protein
MEQEIPTVKRKCNQSEIALKWWSEKWTKLEQQDLLLKEKGQLVREVVIFLLQLNDLKSSHAWFKAGKKQAEHQKDSLHSLNETLAEDNKALVRKLAEAVAMKATLSSVKDPLSTYGRSGKIQDNNSFVVAVGGAAAGLLSVSMKKTQAVTWLYTVCKALFGSCIFSIEATKMV